MSVELHPMIARYFEAGNSANEEAFIACFAADAVVIDENQTREGREAILEWFRWSRQQYSFQSEPQRGRTEGNKSVIVSTVSGNFPGSPVDLTYSFELKEDLISKLVID